MVKPGRITKDLFDDSLLKEFNDKVSKDAPIEWEKIINKPQLADGSWKPPVQSPADLPLVGNSDGDIRLTLSEEKYVFTWSAKHNQWILIGANDTSVDWIHIQNKPVSYPASSHQHKEADISDLDKYTKAEIDTKLTGKSNTNHTHAYSSLTGIPTNFQPSSHTHSESDIIDLDKYTKSEIDTKLSSKANSSHTHTIANVTNLSTELDKKVDKVTGKSLSTNDFTTDLKLKLESLSNNASVDYSTMSGQLSTHTSDTGIHMSLTEKETLGTVAGKADKTYVDNQLKDKASASTLSGHIDNTTIHITSTERANWNGKSNFSGNYSDLIGIPTTFPPATHSHGWTEITGKPATFAPSTHSHGWTEITGKPTTFAPSMHTHSYNDLTDKPTIENYSVSVGTTQPSTADMWYKVVG